MTSANVINFTITKAGNKVGSHSEHMLCKPRLKELLKFQPPEDFKIQSTWLDEHEAPHEGEQLNLADFLRQNRIIP
jgi:hypothetical protein